MHASEPNSTDSAAAAPFTVQRLTTLAELTRLEQAWLSLWERCTWATPFQHPAWLLAWCRQFGPVRLLVFAMWQSGRLVGLAPLLVRTSEEGRKIGLLGGGVSDYLDLLLEPRLSRAGVSVLLAQLDAECGPRDVCEFEQLRVASPLLGDDGASGWTEQRQFQEACPVLELPPHAGALERVVSPRLLHNVRYARRRLARLGSSRIELATERDLDSALEGLFQLHSARWGARCERGVLADAAVQQFHRQAARGLLASDALRLYTLFFDAERIAALYAVHAHGRTFYYLGGFDPQFERFSPGSVLIATAIEDAILRADVEFDFLRGSEPYKYAWGATDRPLQRRTLRRPASEREKEEQ